MLLKYRLHMQRLCYVCMYVKQYILFTDASIVNKIVVFHKGRQTSRKKSQRRFLQKERKKRKKT